MQPRARLVRHHLLGHAGLQAGDVQSGVVTLIQRVRSAANIDGFGLHAAVRVEAQDRKRLAALVPRPRLHLICSVSASLRFAK